MSQTHVEKGALAVGGFAAILAAACSLGPRVLVSLGLGGSWIENLAVFLRPVFIGAALLAMFFAYRRIYPPASKCKTGELCALPEARQTYKVEFWVVAALVLIALGSPRLLLLF